MLRTRSPLLLGGVATAVLAVGALEALARDVLRRPATAPPDPFPLGWSMVALAIAMLGGALAEPTLFGRTRGGRLALLTLGWAGLAVCLGILASRSPTRALVLGALAVLAMGVALLWPAPAART